MRSFWHASVLRLIHQPGSRCHRRLPSWKAWCVVEMTCKNMVRQERNRQQARERRPHQHQSVPLSRERLVATLSEELAAVERAIADHIK
jgi:hypothetical protein